MRNRPFKSVFCLLPFLAACDSSPTIHCDRVAEAVVWGADADGKVLIGDDFLTLIHAEKEMASWMDLNDIEEWLPAYALCKNVEAGNGI